jgi:glycosyltransferase involved in cell wall biosynthesis
MLTYLAPWSEQLDGIASGMRGVLPKISERCRIQVVELRAYDGSPEYLNYLNRACREAELVHIEHNFAYFRGQGRGDHLNDVLQGVTAPLIISTNEVPRIKVRFPPDRRVVREGLQFLAARKTFRKADVVYSYTSYQRDSLKKIGVPGDRIRWVPHYIPDRPITDPDAASAWRKSVGMSSSDILLLTFGFINPRKKIDLALEALSKLPPNFKLVVGGGAALEADRIYVEQLKGLAEDLGVIDRLIITGYLSEELMALAMESADIVVFPPSESYSSGSLARAISFRKAIVSADTATTREILQTEECAVVFRPDDPVDFARVVRQVAKDNGLRENLQSAADRYARRYSVATRIDDYISVYKSLTNANVVSGSGLEVLAAQPSGG